MSWQQLSVSTDKNLVPEISDLLSELGAVSVTYLDAAEQPVYEPLPGETKIWQATRIVGLFEMDSDLDIIISVMCKQFSALAPEQWQQEILQDQVWERTWMEHYQPMKFAKKLWVCPTDQIKNEAGTVCLILDPGLAFGTGTHPTTALCLEWLASHDISGKTVIDYGCGSGILAIAAVLLGARHAHALDIDPQALTATHDNAMKNNVSEQISLYLPEQLPAMQADIVMANILAKPLIELSKQITRLVNPAGGELILSGILQEQAEAVRTTYQQQLMMSPPTMQGDWCRLDGHSK